VVLFLQINNKEVWIMPVPVKVVCPKCKARLKIASEKIVSEMVKCKCPGCGTVLRIKKPSQEQDMHSLPASPAAQPTRMDKAGPGGDVSSSAQRPDSEQESADNEKVGKTVMQTQGKKAEALEKDEEDSVPEEEERSFAEAGDTRIFKRVKFKKKVLVDNQIMVEALDISENGLFLHTGRSFDMGAIVEVAIPTSAGNFDLKVQARVQHNQRGIGMGLMFIDVDDTQKAKLQKLINSLDAAAQQELEGRMRILLVGGSDTARNINKSKLVLDGFYVMQATSVEAVNKILQQERPDAIVMDWQEASFSCKELFYQIKENRQNDNIVIVVLSTLTDAAVQKEILDAGADRYMAKMDTNPVKLSMTLKKLLEERKG
jgi:CheY-like chemotaxis protein